MGYIKAETVLPAEIIELIQQYVDGKNIYIPRKPAGMGDRNADSAGTAGTQPADLCRLSCRKQNFRVSQ